MHEGESGRKNQPVHQIDDCVDHCIVSRGTYLTFLNTTAGAIDPNVSPSIFFLPNSIILATGTLFAMWLGERITDKGIGNGVSLIIMIGIIATLPRSFVGEFTKAAV